MKQHNTHLLSEDSYEENEYQIDNSGNAIYDSIEDVIYNKFIDL